MPVVARANAPNFASNLITRHITLVCNEAQELDRYIVVLLPGPWAPLYLFVTENALCMYIIKYSETLSKLERFELLTAATMKILFSVMQLSVVEIYQSFRETSFLNPQGGRENKVRIF